MLQARKHSYLFALRKLLGSFSDHHWTLKILQSVVSVSLVMESRLVGLGFTPDQAPGHPTAWRVCCEIAELLT